MVESQVRFAVAGDIDFVCAGSRLTPETARRKMVGQEILVAVSAGERVGYAQLEYLWARVPFLALIRVLPEYRRRGVGRALLGFLEESLRARGQEALYSSAMADEPEPQAWHRRMGFEECGFIAGINEGGVGEVFFRKPLRR